MVEGGAVAVAVAIAVIVTVGGVNVNRVVPLQTWSVQ